MKTLDEVKALLGNLPGADLPLVLIPVQVQTRFVNRDGQSQLLIRVFPDEFHIDSHEEQLMAVEADWGRHYWELIWDPGLGQEPQRRAWEQLADRFGTSRAAWIARQMTPTNLAQRVSSAPIFPDPGPLKADSWTLPAQARLLPDRWVAAGYIGAERVLLEAGRPILDPLAVSLSPENSTIPLPGEEDLPIDEGIRWMVNFDEAERVGMAIRILLPTELVGSKFDRLLVFGVKAQLSVAKSSDFLENLLIAHHYTHGCEILAAGTPTNNSAEASSGYSRRGPDAQSSYAVEIKPPHLDADSGGSLAARMLGVRRDVFTKLEGSNQEEDLDARHMLTVLWPVTGKYYLEQILSQPLGQPPIFSQEDMDQARRYFIDYVRPGGPLPSMRVGAQPYGLLPVLSLGLLANTSASKNRFIQGLLLLRGAWKNGLGGVPHLQPGVQASDPLIDILRMQPVSVGFRGRLAFDQQFFVPTGVMQRTIDPNLKFHNTVLRTRLRELAAESLVGDGRVFDLLPAETARKLSAPLVQPGGEIPGSSLTPNYITFMRTASFDDILNENFPPGEPEKAIPDTLFYLILRQSVLLAYLDVARRILVRRGTLADEPIREPTLVDIAGGLKSSRSRTLLRILDLDPDLRASLHTLVGAQEPEASVLEEMRASLTHLEILPVDTLSRHMCGCLDLFAYRLDAWITSLATRRLVELRASRPRGLGIGSFGWVENLEPRPRTPISSPPSGENDQPLFASSEKGGFIHTPSLDQAAAAAVLRSGYLSQPGANNSRPFAIDLSSQRVRLAQWLLDGIRQGQPLGALLGYRFERGLHERKLDRFIDGFRRVSLLAAIYKAKERLRQAQSMPPGAAKTAALAAAQAEFNSAQEALNRRYQFPLNAGVGALEKVSAARVADGLALSQLFETGELPFDQVAPPGGPPISSQEQVQLEVELRSLQSAVDALSDALTAEGVYQVVRGNPDRASASIDSVAHGEVQPPELTFTEIHRPGITVTHRLVTILSGPAPASPVGARQFRARAEPRLNAWLVQMLGPLTSVVCLADFVDKNGQTIGTRKKILLSALEISHLDAIYLSAAAQSGQPSDLERLLEYRLRKTAPANVPADARLRIFYERPPIGLTDAQLSLGQFLEVAAEFRQTLLKARPLQGRDLIQSEKDPPDGLDPVELQSRADQAVNSLRQTLSSLSSQRIAVENATGPNLEPALNALRERMLDLFFMGFTDALPFSPRGSNQPQRDELLIQAQAINQAATQQLEQIEAGENGFERAVASAVRQVEHDLTRLKTVFGKSFLALPLISPSNAQELNRAFVASPNLLGGDPLQALSWLQAAARVRPAVSHLEIALSFAAALVRPSALELRVAQLPFQPGERWIGLPFTPGSVFPVGKISLVAHLPKPFSPAQPLAGFLVDGWVEVIPSPQITSGVALNYDAPGARPPQSILLAVLPTEAPGWDVETLEKTLLETFDQAQLRAVDPQALADEVIQQRLLPALYFSNNLSGDTLSTDFSRAIR